MAYVYIMASGRNGTFYVGVTTDLSRRGFEHSSKQTDGFTARHGVSKLVWAERFDSVTDAIAREKQLKKWKRAWKLALIEEANPDWRDLFEFGLE
ncbi:GIY-YIG nuclease family protein [Breoghania sp. L-A4]|uniref:GIY-YIG nuclease family protein n=1 Tax=Breoghania sp. L-A4 TaxID=2304600 RepID=UPI000E35FD69|nr:GIY-YIG nuclease family protein [Breoghania sp. L-A4]AXS40548.1 GIY-YIG nuclease family protein [Breoghania sp. L-A4]